MYDKLTREQTIKLHRHMWNWLADETEKTGKMVNRYDYFYAVGMFRIDQPDHGCYCCEYAAQQSVKNIYENYCKYCPLDWKSACDEYMCFDKKEVDDDEGLYARWQNAGDIDKPNIKKRIKLARKIANLKER